MGAVYFKIKKGVPYKMDTDDNPSFEEWMARIDYLLDRKFGLCTRDLPDVAFRDMYDTRLRPIRAANRVLKEAGADYFD